MLVSKEAAPGLDKEAKGCSDAGSAGFEENAAAVSIDISADTEDALLEVFAPGAATGLRYPETTSFVWRSDRTPSF
jgi:hypothetical protein